MDSISRLVSENARDVRTVNTSPLKRHLDNVTGPPSLSGGLRKAGIALIAAPDLVAGVPGVALLASSFVVKRREPAGLENPAQETRRVLREIQSLSL
jgi:hypothetical protein